jgi:hypothetical protein
MFASPASHPPDRSPHGRAGGKPFAASPALTLLAASSLTLMAASLWPRAGAPVLLTTPHEAAAAVFAVPGWRVVSASQLGPFTFTHAIPDHPSASPFGLLRATGGWLVTSAAPRGGCA